MLKFYYEKKNRKMRIHTNIYAAMTALNSHKIFTHLKQQFHEVERKGRCKSYSFNIYWVHPLQLLQMTRSIWVKDTANESVNL